MSRAEWLVCERTAGWASALRLALAAAAAPIRLRELRLVSELDAELTARPHSFAVVEAHRGNFAALLGWLAQARDRHAGATFAIVVDRSLSPEIDPVAAALLETGAQAIATSPRRLETVVALGQRHGRISANTAESVSFVDQVRASLPWQAV